MQDDILIPYDDIGSYFGWWEYDLSDFNIIINSGSLTAGMYESYVPNSGWPPSPNVYGWSIYIDKDNGGNSFQLFPLNKIRSTGNEFLIDLVVSYEL